MEPLFLTHLREQLSIKGCQARGDARAAVQSAQGDLRAVRTRHAADRGLARLCRARRRCSAECGKICIAVSEDIDPPNTDAVFWSTGLSCQSDRGRACRAASLRRARSEIRPAQRRVDHAADRRHAETFGAAARVAGARIHGAGAKRSGRSSNCPRSRRSRPGTAIRSATGRRTGRSMPSARWPASGKRAGQETFARRRGGLIPETPVREVEGKESKD